VAPTLTEYRVRIRNGADNADLLVLTSVNAGTNPYIKGPPKGDGADFNPMTADQMAASYTVTVVDAITSGTSRVLTSQLEDVNALLQLGFMKTYIEWRKNGGAWATLTCGYLVLLRLTDAITWELTVQDALRAMDGVNLFSPSSTTLITDFLALWPNRGCLFGGPVLGSFLTTKDFGGWTMRVRDGSFPNQGQLYWLDPMTVYGPTDSSDNWHSIAEISKLNVQTINDGVKSLTRTITPNQSPLTPAGSFLVGFSYQIRAVGTTNFVAIGAASNTVGVVFIATGAGAGTGVAMRSNALLTIADAMGQTGDFPNNPWPGLIVLIDSGSGPVAFFPLQPGSAVQGADDASQTGDDIVLVSKKVSGVFVPLTGQTPLTLGSAVKVRALTILPTPVCPVYLDRHPIDLLSDMCAYVGIGFSDLGATVAAGAFVVGENYQILTVGTTDYTAIGAASNTIGVQFWATGAGAGTGTTRIANVCKNVFGPIHISVRITGQLTMGDLLKGAVFGLGIGIRQDASGNVVPFPMRRLGNATPTKIIDGTLIVEGSVSQPFEQDVTWGGLQQFVFTHKAQRVSMNSPDSVTETDQTFTEYNGDASPLLSGTETITLLGMLRPNAATTDPIGQDWVVGEGRLLFDRFGRANQTAEMDLRRGDGTTDADTVQYGDEILIDIPQLPNHNKRLGDDGSVSARAMQVIRILEAPSRRPVRLSDSGPNAQPLATKPTHTIAASANLPRTVAAVTITNAATLNGLGYAVELQLAVTTGGAPQLSDYATWYTSQPAAIPTLAIAMPAVIAGRTVYVRGRSLLAGARPSNWQTGVSVTLSTIDDPTSVAAAAVSGDGSLENLTWVIGTNAGADLADIYLRLSAEAFSAAVRQITLLPGSVQYQLERLTPGTAYKASVQHRDPLTGDVSDPVDVSFTSDAGVIVLTPPYSPIGSSGSLNDRGEPVRDGRYGLAIAATEFPAFVEVQEAVETAIGSGAYGAYATLGIMPSLSGDWTVVAATAPNDGLRRSLQARHIRDGAASSGFTTPVIVTPWSYAAIPPYSPTLHVVVTPGPLAYSIDWSTSVGLVELSIDGGAFGTPGASPISVTLDVAAHAYDFRSSLGGQFIPNHVSIPAGSGGGGGGSPTITSITVTPLSSPCDGGGSMTVAWTTSGMPGGETYDVQIAITSGTYAGWTQTYVGVSSGDTFSPALCPGQDGTVAVTARNPGAIATASQGFTS